MPTLAQRLYRGQQLEKAAARLEQALRDADLEVRGIERGGCAAGCCSGHARDPHPRWSVRLVEELVAAGVLALPVDRGA